MTVTVGVSSSDSGSQELPLRTLISDYGYFNKKVRIITGVGRTTYLSATSPKIRSEQKEDFVLGISLKSFVFQLRFLFFFS